MIEPSHASAGSHERYLGIDVGGTTIKYGLVTEDGKILHQQFVATTDFSGPKSAVQYGLEFARLTEGNLNHLAGVGLAVPGVLDTQTWSLKEVVNLPHWIDRPLLEIVQQETNVPSAVINDANAAALAEHKHRQLNTQTLALVTLGTGIGCGLAIGEQDLSGDHGCAGELGHVTVDSSHDASRCNCGKRGHLEAYAGAPAVVARAINAFTPWEREALPLSLRQPKIGTREIGVAAEEGFEPARQIILETAKYLGVAIGMMGQIIDPSVVLLGGAMTFGGNSRQIGRDFLSSIRQSVRESTLKQVGENLTIEYASLGNTAGIAGAAQAAQHKGREV